MQYFKGIKVYIKLFYKCGIIEKYRYTAKRSVTLDDSILAMAIYL